MGWMANAMLVRRTAWHDIDMRRKTFASSSNAGQNPACLGDNITRTLSDNEEVNFYVWLRPTHKTGT
jgi:hypothetical protein